MKWIGLVVTLVAAMSLAACSTIQNHDLPPEISGNHATPP